MKVAQKRFSVPFCILDEPMPAKALKLLIHLLSISSVDGACRPGYAQMRRAIREHEDCKGSDATVRKHLAYLMEKQWISHMRRTNSKMIVWLRIPPRLRSELVPKTPLVALWKRGV